MSLLQDLRPLKTPGATRRRPTRRAVTWTLAALLAGTAISGLVYRANYQPLTPGGTYGAGPSRGIMVLGDGIETTRWVVLAPGEPAHFEFSLANRGRHAVKVLSIGDSADDPIHDVLGLSVTRRGELLQSQCCTDFASLPFAPLVLKPGHELLIRVEVTSRRCLLRESGGRMWRSTIPVRYQAWGHRATAELPLPLPLVRYCTPAQIQPPAFPSPRSGDSALVPTGYGFAVPRGWTSPPITYPTDRPWFTSWTAPDRKSKVDYELTSDDPMQDNPEPTEADARAATGCALADFRAVSPSHFTYTCTAPKGTLRRGVIRFSDRGDDIERIEITSADETLVAEFLRSVKA